MSPGACVEPGALPWTSAVIESILPHRDPFLLVDRITSFEPDRKIVGQRTFGAAEALIRDPSGAPAVPGSYLTECMAQVGAILVLRRPENVGKLIFFLRIDRVRFRSPVHLGETVCVEATVENLRSRIGTLRGECRVDDRRVAEGVMTFALGPAAEAGRES